LLRNLAVVVKICVDDDDGDDDDNNNNNFKRKNGKRKDTYTVSEYEGFEVLTAVVTKSSIFWDITPCSPLKVKRRFGGTYRIHLQGRRISRARNQNESKWQTELCDMFLRNAG
jgi:hypothetical protein